jgi:hypothetical protein
LQASSIGNTTAADPLFHSLPLPLPLQLAPAFKEAHPETPLTYREWGFERLRDYLEKIPESVVVTPDGSGRGFTLTVHK